MVLKTDPASFLTLHRHAGFSGSRKVGGSSMPPSRSSSTSCRFALGSGGATACATAISFSITSFCRSSSFRWYLAEGGPAVISR